VRLATDVGNGAVFECGFSAAGDGVPVAGGIAERACWATVRVPRPKYLARNGMCAGMGRPVDTSMLKLVESAAIWRCPLTRGRFPEPTAGAASVLILLKNRSLNNEISCRRADSAGGDGTRHVGGVAGRRLRTACDQNNSGENDEEAMGVRTCRYHRYTVPRVAPQVTPITVAGYPTPTREIYSLPVILAVVSNRHACCRIVAA